MLYLPSFFASLAFYMNVVGYKGMSTCRAKTAAITFYMNVVGYKACQLGAGCSGGLCFI